MKPYQLKPRESEECRAFWQWAQYFPEIREYLIKIVNEGERSVITGKNLKDIGMRPGIPDYFFCFPNSKWHGLWIEMKRKGDEARPANKLQLEWISKLRRVGYYATFCYGLEHAQTIIMDYFNNRI